MPPGLWEEAGEVSERLCATRIGSGPVQQTSVGEPAVSGYWLYPPVLAGGGATWQCHGPRGHEVKAAYPSLAGQPADYLRLQLQLFKDDRRGGSAYAHLMQPVASRLTPEQMRDVALYFESLGGE